MFKVAEGSNPNASGTTDKLVAHLRLHQKGFATSDLADICITKHLVEFLATENDLE